MQDFDTTAEEIVQQMNAGHTNEAADLLDKAYNAMRPEEFRQVVKSMEQKCRGDRLDNPARSGSDSGQLAINDWILYTPWQGSLMQTRGR